MIMGTQLKGVDKTYRPSYNTESYKLWWKNLCFRSATTGKPSESSVNTYASNLLSFLKYYKGSINTITIDDIFGFFDSRGKEIEASTKKDYIIALLDYITFLKDNKPIELSHKMLFHKAEDKRVNHKVDAITLDELITLRNNLKQNNKYIDMLILDFIYYYGFTLEELKHCKGKNYSFEKSCFVINGKKYYMDEQVEENLMACAHILDNTNEKDYVRAITKMGTLFNKHFSWRSFYNLRQKHLIVCPSCNNKYVNDARFWVLAQREKDVFDTKVVVCRKCAAKFKG
jgi:integrase